MIVELDIEEVKALTADAKGRVTIGAQYAGEDVRVAIVEVDADE